MSSCLLGSITKQPITWQHLSEFRCVGGLEKSIFWSAKWWRTARKKVSYVTVVGAALNIPQTPDAERFGSTTIGRVNVSSRGSVPYDQSADKDATEIICSYNRGQQDTTSSDDMQLAGLNSNNQTVFTCCFSIGTSGHRFLKGFIPFLGPFATDWRLRVQFRLLLKATFGNNVSHDVNDDSAFTSMLSELWLFFRLKSTLLLTF